MAFVEIFFAAVSRAKAEILPGAPKMATLPELIAARARHSLRELTGIRIIPGRNFMKTRRILTLLVMTLLAVSAAIAQDKTQKIDALLKNYYDYGQLNGAVLVAENGKVIYKKGFGLANMEWDIPNQPDTRFRIGSVTKQFTAALILQLVEEGKIKLDARVTDYLPDYRKDTGERVTIHQLLNHTSGIPSYTGLPGFMASESRNSYKVNDFVKKFASGDLEFEPGTKYSYNNSGYFLLGAIIEQITGKPYAQVLQERILDPVGMKDTGYDLASPLIKKRAWGYEKTSGGDYRNAAYLDMTLPYAAGSLYSTVEDLYKWDQALYDNKIISEASKKAMFTPGLSNYGYGFNIQDIPLGKTDQKIKIIGHSGGINGFNSYLTRVVDQKHLIVILDNVGLGNYHRAMTVSIINILNNQPYDAPKKSIAETLYKTAAEKGGAATVAEYRRLKAANAGIYDFSEDELNRLGYQLLGQDKTKDAIEIFKLNVEMFPAAANPYDSLGEAYLKDGQKDLALVNYKKSVELNPNNAGAIQAIKRLEGRETKVDPAVLETYVGEYEINPRLTFTVTREGGKLMGQMGSQPKLELEPVSETQFAVSAVKANISFEKDSDGKVMSLVLQQGARTVNAKKIK
jgi:CubicO group peptidase (beta-lactamase class C family)